MLTAKSTVLAGAAWIVRNVAKRRRLQTMLFNAVRLDRPEMHEILLSDEMRLTAYCLARRDRSRSQIMQDLWVCFELGEKENGYFVEFGATNGLKNSNSWLLEQELGWTGILAEPNPFWHRKLASNRRCLIEHRCVSSRSGETVGFLTTNATDPELSGIAAFSDGDHFALTRSRGECIQVETISLDDLLEQCHAPPVIDYLSVDTEGSELDILSAYSFSRKFKTISVESNPRNEGPIEQLLRSKGYVRVFEAFSQWDSWYVASELRDGRALSIIAPEA